MRRVSSYLAFPPLPLTGASWAPRVSPQAARHDASAALSANEAALLGLICAFSEAVYLCCTFPEVAFGGRYPLFLPCGARTFLIEAPFGESTRLSVPVAELLYFIFFHLSNTLQNNLVSVIMEAILRKEARNLELDAYFNRLKGKKILVLGLGVSNRPLVRLLLRYGIAVTGCDKASREQLDAEVLELERLGLRLHLGEGYLEDYGRRGFPHARSAPGKAGACGASSGGNSNHLRNGGVF